jgi:hypothetical protein
MRNYIRLTAILLCVLVPSGVGLAAGSSGAGNQVNMALVGKPCSTSDGKAGTWHVICTKSVPKAGSSGVAGRGTCVSRNLVCQVANKL